MSDVKEWTNIFLGDLTDGCRGVSYHPEHLLEERTDNSIILLRANNIQNGQLSYDNIQIVPNRLVKENQLLQKGDIAVCMSNGSKILVGKAAQYTEEQGGKCTVGAFCSVFKPKKNTVREFIRYLFGSQTYQRHIDISLAGSAINNLKNSDIEAIVFSIPSTNHQKKIASILDTIDQIIEKTEALIHKYQQIKAGLMHDLFTRGLTAAGKLRPPREQAPELYQETPIGWIPKEWEVVPLGQMSDITSGVTLSSKTSLDQKLEVPYLRVANVQDGYLDLSEIKTIKVNQKTFENLLLKKGDVLMNEGGDFDKLGRGTVWQDEIDNCIHQNHVFRVRVNQEQLRPYYLAYWSESDFGKKYFVLSSKQSTNLASINSTQLKAYHIAKPEQEEQERIESRVNSANLIIQNLKNENLKLTFQKSGLMHDLLTGKVPVTIDQEETAHG